MRDCGLQRLQQQGLELSQMTRPVRRPMRVPVAGGTACRALASVLFVQRAASMATLPNIARFALAPPRLAASGIHNVMSAREAAEPSTASRYIRQFQSNARSRERASRLHPLDRHDLHGLGDTPQGDRTRSGDRKPRGCNHRSTTSKMMGRLKTRQRNIREAIHRRDLRCSCRRRSSSRPSEWPRGLPRASK
jgi:hypothetical protein